ncbi:MAG: DUF4129 domain-containing protein [Candidatus Dormibacteria bacterium]
MKSGRRSLLVLPLLASAAALLMGAAPAAASGCSTAYVAQLRQIRDDLEAGSSVPDAVRQLQALASQDAATAALEPVISDLQDGDVGGAEALLGAAVTTLQASGGSACGAETSTERQALAGVYRSPTFANLDQPATTNWVQRVLDAIGSFLGHVVGTLGPLATIILTALVLAVVVAIATWRIRQVIASGEEPAPDQGSVPDATDAEEEWAGALAASERGDFREAVRRAFRSALVSLVQRGRLPVQAAWTTPELLAHAGGDAELSARLAPAAAGFDRAWYSDAPVDADHWEEVRGECQAIRALPARGRPPA